MGKTCSLLSKFESEFQKIYTTQMEWKVPDPRLRRRLRQAITEKIIPGYKKYIEDNKVTNPKISPLIVKKKKSVHSSWKQSCESYSKDDE
jgi:hypothetical protein